MLSPKCHPEVAGVGVDYNIGYSKLRFRRKFNDTVAEHLLDNVLKCLDNKKCTSVGESVAII